MKHYYDKDSNFLSISLFNVQSFKFSLSFLMLVTSVEVLLIAKYTVKLNRKKLSQMLRLKKTRFVVLVFLFFFL